MDTARAVWRISKAGSLDRLQLRDERLPPPAPGEVQVAVRAVGLNFADAFACLGLYSATPRGSFVPGLEVAGIVTAAGAPLPGHPVYEPGERVLALTRFGGYATALNVDTRYLAPVPADWSFEAAANRRRGISMLPTPMPPLIVAPFLLALLKARAVAAASE